MIASAVVPTSKPLAYLRQLCRHVGHRVETEYDGHAGRIAFPHGRCDLVASADRLNVQVVADDDDALAHLQELVGGHLERFGRRDALEVVWQRIE